MSILTINSGRSRVIMGTVEYQSRRTLGGAKWDGIFLFSRRLSCKLHRAFGTNVKAFASRHSGKVVNKDRKLRKSETPQNNKNPSIQNDEPKDGSSDNSAELLNSDLATKSSNLDPTRRVVLQACIVTSGFILALGVIIRQVLHIAFMKGWLDQDSTTDVSFDFQMWHLELIIGLVMLISSCRYLLLKMWPDFANSSEAANQQVLGSLQPLDFLVVAILPGISEEILFRGALLPSFGLNWESALAVGAIFGALHLGSGRRYSFAIWATFVGFAYGFATILSSSLIVPMASHSLNNLIGGILWRYSSIPEKTRN